MVLIGGLICSGSVFVVDDCCLSRFGDDTLLIEIGGGGGGVGGSIVGISTGTVGKNGRADDIAVRFATCWVELQNWND